MGTESLRYGVWEKGKADLESSQEPGGTGVWGDPEQGVLGMHREEAVSGKPC